MADRYPWDYHPDLTAERIGLVAALIAQGRNDALDRFDREVGDNAWTLGTCAYAYGTFRIKEAAKSGEHPWLGVVDPTNQFIFRIGDVPIRFYRGPAEEPTARTMRQSFPELRQLSLMLEGGSLSPALTYRIAIETGDFGEILRMVFVGIRGETVVLTWEVPLAPMPATLYPVDRIREEGVELPPPRVAPARAGTDVGTGRLPGLDRTGTDDSGSAV